MKPNTRTPPGNPRYGLAKAIGVTGLHLQLANIFQSALA
jgi:hypothetical protein